MTTRYFLYISYKGTNYHGWQIQPHSVSVQEVLENSLSTILNIRTDTTGAGRTDTGVHALHYCLHFDSEIPDLDKRKNFIFRLNGLLPTDISANYIRKVLPEAHARFSALSRTYKYYISRIKDPFHEDTSWYIYGNINMSVMNEAAMMLKEYNDFTSFSRLHSDNKTNICKIFSAAWEEEENRIIFTVKADRFLRNMVRAIVGTMTDLGRDKINTADFQNIIEAKDRCRAGKSAPAKGLFLTDIEYPETIFF
jgi:tRNA pseudouridine38-40 synthase